LAVRLFALLVITVSFIPVFSLEAQEAGSFKPGVHEDLLDVLCGAAGRDALAVLMLMAVRGKITPKSKIRSTDC